MNNNIFNIQKNRIVTFIILFILLFVSHLCFSIEMERYQFPNSKVSIIIPEGYKNIGGVISNDKGSLIISGNIINEKIDTNGFYNELSKEVLKKNNKELIHKKLMIFSNYDSVLFTLKRLSNSKIVIETRIMINFISYSFLLGLSVSDIENYENYKGVIEEVIKSIKIEENIKRLELPFKIKLPSGYVLSGNIGLTKWEYVSKYDDGFFNILGPFPYKKEKPSEEYCKRNIELSNKSLMEQHNQKLKITENFLKNGVSYYFSEFSSKNDSNKNVNIFYSSIYFKSCELMCFSKKSTLMSYDIFKETLMNLKIKDSSVK